MKKTSETILFFGNERLATSVSTTAPILRSLATSSNYRVAAVVVNRSRHTSRKQRQLEIEQVAFEHNIPIIDSGFRDNLYDQLSAFSATIGVLVAYGKIIPSSIIKLLPKGIVNIHPSDLPVGRGPAPIEQTIIEGKINTAVSLMSLEPEMDAGPVYAKSHLRLAGNESKQDLADKLLDTGRQLLLANLERIISGQITPEPQDSILATYSKLIAKSDGVIDWNKPAALIEREIRAYLGWPGSRSTLAKKDVIITQAFVVNEHGKPGKITITGNRLTVFCGEQALIVNKLKPAGKNEMSSQAFIAGYMSN